LTGTIYGILYKREKGKVGGGREEKKGKERKRKAKVRLRILKFIIQYNVYLLLIRSKYLIKFMRSLLHQLADWKIAQRGKSNSMSPTDYHLLPVNGRDDLALLVSVANRWWQSSGE